MRLTFVNRQMRLLLFDIEIYLIMYKQVESSIYFCRHEEACASFTKGLAKCDSKLRGALILDLISTHQLRQNKQ